MNKLMGLLELKEMRLPSVPWRQYTGNEVMDGDCLWTVRSAKYRGKDFDLPRSIGKNAEESTRFADRILHTTNGIVIFYPYFIAKKSGTLCVGKDRVIIEAVKGDLWNLVTDGKPDISILYENGGKKIAGSSDFLTENEETELISYLPEIRRQFRSELFYSEVLFEWSIAVNCNKEKKPTGNPYLVFYEARTV